MEISERRQVIGMHDAGILPAQNCCTFYRPAACAPRGDPCLVLHSESDINPGTCHIVLYVCAPVCLHLFQAEVPCE